MAHEDQSHQLNAKNVEPWDPKDALSSLTLDKQLEGEDPQGTANRLMNENAPMAASAVIHLAMNALSDSTRLKAAQYILEYVKETGGVLNPFDAFVAECVKEYEDNQGAI